MDKKKLAEEAMQRHAAWHGKIEVVARCQLNTREDLALAYTPGVAAPCLAIQEQPELSFTLTRRSNLVAVVTDGTAVLGLGDIGPEAGMPVMEGKCALFKAFADVDAFPLCIRSKDPDEKEITDLVKCADGAENIIFSSCNAHLFRGQLALAAALAEKGVPMTVAALRNPYDLPLMPENAALLAAFDYSRDSLAALADVFSGGACCGVIPAAL